MTGTFFIYYFNKMHLPIVIKEIIEDIPLREMRPWLFAALCMAILQALPEQGREMLIYERDALMAGELWRMLTCNYIHLGWNHWQLNMAGFILIGWLFADEAPLSAWVGVLLICCLASSLGMFWLTPDADRVVGMSGVLHGLFVFGAMSWIQHGFRAGWVLLLGVGAKLIWEQTRGAVPLTEAFVGGAVITDAHLWGALGGMFAALIRLVWQRFRTSL